MRAMTGLAVIALAVATVPLIAAPAAADHVVTHANANNEGDQASADASQQTVGDQGTPGGDGGSDEGPECWYEGLKHTTQRQQREEIRPEETRPGQWGWLVCDDGTQEFQFFPDADPVDPEFLARSVVLAPDPPVLHTNPPMERPLVVNFDT